MMEPTLLLKEHQAADLLGLQVTTLRRWRWSGRGPVFRKLGAAVRYHPADLETFIAAGERHSTTDPGPEAA
jgi:predicted site-specific integrase-resolvase